MTIEKKGIYFEANKGKGGSPKKGKLITRAEQRIAILKQEGPDVLRELDLVYELIDLNMDQERKKVKKKRK